MAIGDIVARPISMSRARWAGHNRSWRPSTGIEIQQGDPYGMQPMLARALRVPLDPSGVPAGQQEAPTVQNVPISWTSVTYNSTASENIISAQPNRVILVVQNLSPTNAVAVNFDQTASVSGASPNFVSQGILLLPGVSLYIDKWCPTGTVHISASSAPTVVTQGFSQIGNIPEIAL